MCSRILMALTDNGWTSEELLIVLNIIDVLFCFLSLLPLYYVLSWSIVGCLHGNLYKAAHIKHQINGFYY